MVEGAALDVVGQVLDLADEDVGQPEGDPREAVDENHLPHGPARQLVHVGEDDEHGQEVHERDEELADREQHEGRAELELGADAGADEPAVDGQRLNHPAPPACA